MEKFVQAEIADGLVFRLPKLVGDEPQGNHLFTEFYQQYLEKRPIVCIEGLRFQPTYVKDVAACVLLALQQGLSGLYNVAAPKVYSRFEAAKRFFHCREGVSISEEPLSSGRFRSDLPLDLALDTKKWRGAADFAFADLDAVCERFWRNLGKPPN